MHSSSPDAQHGGQIRKYAEKCGCSPEQILDFSANINPLGFPSWTRSLVARTLSAIDQYPDPESHTFVKAAADYFSVPPEHIVPANGSSEVLFLLPRILDVKRALIPVPAYIDYARVAKRSNLPIEALNLREKANFRLEPAELQSRIRPGDLVFLGQPNNPTGQMLNRRTLRELAENNPQSFFVIDESFADFVQNYNSLITDALPNVTVLRSMTKFYAVPGIRVGFAAAPPRIAERLRESLVPWSVNTFAQAFGEAALRDTDYAGRTRKRIGEWRHSLFEGISQLPRIKVFPSHANFLLGKVTAKKFDAVQMAEHLLQRHKLPIRVCDNFDSLDGRYFRVAVRTETDNNRLLEALADVLDTETKSARPKTPGPRALMIQGTSSNAGKSILCAGLGRVMLQDGIRVAPFKAQNMSLNSFVTRDGGEMGRAQVVQAQACRLDPDVRMNPILLKPSSDTGSQVILQGTPVGNMDVSTYRDYKTHIRETVHACYDSLAAEYDAIIMEGAGSPGEVNLKDDDVVNMKMAWYADAPVLLTGDIDRGGVYASFIGTMEVLEEWERRLIAGFIVNRFRGDPSLLASAHTYVHQHTGRQVVGIIPYLDRLGLPEEDSVEFKSATAANAQEQRASGDVTVTIVDLPHISNFTDFDPLALEPDVTVTVARKPQELGTPDAVIIPGSKNTIADLQALKESGMSEAIRSCLEENRCEVVGICGGFQMLGHTITDPDRIESDQASSRGLGLLNVHTRLARQKTLRRTSTRHLFSDCTLTGYEIHHGETTCGESTKVIASCGDTVNGVASQDCKVWGTYLHGLFDNDDFRRWFINNLRAQRGLPPKGNEATYSIEPALDRLADVLRKNLDIPWLYARMGLQP